MKRHWAMDLRRAMSTWEDKYKENHTWVEHIKLPGIEDKKNHLRSRQKKKIRGFPVMDWYAIWFILFVHLVSSMLQVELELTTLKARVVCSTDWPSQKPLISVLRSSFAIAGGEWVVEDQLVAQQKGHVGTTRVVGGLLRVWWPCWGSSALRRWNRPLGDG